MKTCRRLNHIGPKVTVAQWLTALLVVVMMLQHYTRVALRVLIVLGAAAKGALREVLTKRGSFSEVTRV